MQNDCDASTRAIQTRLAQKVALEEPENFSRKPPAKVVMAIDQCREAVEKQQIMRRTLSEIAKFIEKQSKVRGKSYVNK